MSVAQDAEIKTGHTGYIPFTNIDSWSNYASSTQLLQAIGSRVTHIDGLICEVSMSFTGTNSIAICANYHKLMHARCE